MTTRIGVAVIGAGFAGIAVAARLWAAGHDVRIIERAPRVGGTWRDNVYPGVACDVPSHLYSLADHPHPGWSTQFAPGGEIRDYLERIVAESGLHDVLRLGVALEHADWDAHARRWRLTLAGGETLHADALVLACGRLVEPRLPDVPGIASFPGPVLHTARWDAGFDPAGKRIAVIGTGASAVQLVPQLARRGAEVTVFQRTPAWIVPRGGRDYTTAERDRFARHPELIAALRARLLADDEARFAARAGHDRAAADAARSEATRHLAAQVPPGALRARLTPDYPFGCKRVLRSDDFYPVLASGAAVLEPSALAAVEEGVLVAASGARYADIDAVVLATGFHAQRQPYAEIVRGEDGMSLADHWATGMTSFASTVVAGFPNLFVLNGPNAALAHTSSLLILEEQAGYVTRALGRRTAHGGVLRTRPEAERGYTASIDRRARGTSWLGGCDSWYRDDRSGRLTLLWPGTVADFRAMMAAADGSEFEPAFDSDGRPLTPERLAHYQEV